MSILSELNNSHKRQPGETDESYDAFQDYLHGIINREDIDDDLFISGRFAQRKQAVEMRKQAINQRSLKGQREARYLLIRDTVEKETDRMFRIAEKLGINIERRLDSSSPDPEGDYATDKTLPAVRSYLESFKVALTTSLEMLGVE